MTSRSVNKQQLCRLCAENKDNTGFIGIYEPEGRKLGIENKITKCLQIQIFINDSLPMYICLECCLLLNQCDDFFQKTNQAQCSLRQMLLDPKNHCSQEIYQNISGSELQLKDHYTERIEEVFTKEEYEVSNKIENSNDHEYDDNSNGSEEKLHSTDTITTDNKYVSNSNENINQENNQKKVKKKNSLNKFDDFEWHNSEIEKIKLNEDERSNVKIPDNYMTGTASDMEIISQSEKKDSSEQSQISGRKKGEKPDRYPWLCTDCNDKLPSLEALERHHETIHNQKAKYMCVQCCKVYEKYYGFLTHVKRHKTKAKFSCDDCGKSFVHKKVLDAHKVIHSEERPHTCQTCGKTFRQQSALYIHSRCHLPENMKNKYPCDQCDKRFSTKPNLVTHKRIHSGVRNFTCDQCGKSFIQKGNLEAHFLTHSADKPHKCSQCSKAFKTAVQLKKHETVHTGDKPHKCGVCGRTFREKGTLREHQRIHTGAMPFSCEFCGKCFRFKGILTTHRRQHTGERPYSCETCQHHFTNWPNYNKHMKRKHGINTSQTQRPPKSEPPPKQAQIKNNEKNLPVQQHHSPRQITRNGPRPILPAPPAVNVSATTVQVIQTLPPVTVTQPIVLQSLSPSSSSTSIHAFIESENPLEEDVSPANLLTDHSTPHQQTQPLSTAIIPSNYTLSMPLANFLNSSTVPYNFYNVSVNDADVSQHR